MPSVTPDVMAAVIENLLTTAGVGVSMPKWEEVKDRVLMLQVDPADIPRTVTPTDNGGVIDQSAAALIADGWITPPLLEEVGNWVSTYPYNRPVAAAQADDIDRMGV